MDSTPNTIYFFVEIEEHKKLNDPKPLNGLRIKFSFVVSLLSNIYYFFYDNSYFHELFSFFSCRAMDTNHLTTVLHII